jgi:hypothetical protein
MSSRTAARGGGARRASVCGQPAAGSHALVPPASASRARMNTEEAFILRFGARCACGRAEKCRRAGGIAVLRAGEFNSPFACAPSGPVVTAPRTGHPRLANEARSAAREAARGWRRRPCRAMAPRARASPAPPPLQATASPSNGRLHTRTRKFNCGGTLRGARLGGMGTRSKKGSRSRGGRIHLRGRRRRGKAWPGLAVRAGARSNGGQSTARCGVGGWRGVGGRPGRLLGNREQVAGLRSV